MYIDDCVKGIDMIMHCDELIATPINLGSSELVSINDLVSHGRGDRRREAEAQVRPRRPARAWPAATATTRSSSRSWAGSRARRFRDGLAKTYAWIEQQYQDRKAGKRTVSERRT